MSATYSFCLSLPSRTLVLPLKSVLVICRWPGSLVSLGLPQLVIAVLLDHLEGAFSDIGTEQWVLFSICGTTFVAHGLVLVAYVCWCAALQKAGHTRSYPLIYTVC